MKLVSNLNFNGQCQEAFETYAKVLGGEITALMRWADMPGEPGAPVEEAWRNKILHAWLQIGDQAIMGCDVPPAHAQTMGGFAVTFHSEDLAQSRRVFEGLAEGGQVQQPLRESFFSPLFGMLTDRFGTPWMINTIPAGRPA